jgi:transcriptional regulator with GAF, ATPase, and Fis domain
MNMDSLPDVILAIAQEPDLASVLQQIVERMVDCPEEGFAKKTEACADIALVRIWLKRPGDQCAECRFSEQCPDRTFCLHLAASAGKPLDAVQNWMRLDGEFRRFPIGVRKVGRIAATGKPILISNFSIEHEWIVRPEWARSEGISCFAGHPLIFRGEMLGVIGMFSRTPFRAGDPERLQSFASHAAVAIGNARALEEIDRLKVRLEEEVSYLREEVGLVKGKGDLVGASPAMSRVQQQIDLVAPTSTTVLITGESGTGKELVARAVHQRSPRRERPMITVNCGAVPEALFESEFFGHVRGSFTGALRDKVGRFELADGGTLFLDEIGEVPLHLQTKLLRVLQEQEIERVGDPSIRRIDVRVIAATNRNLREDVAAGRFRQDLFYRLSVFPIENPPLRDRREDIPMLASHFLQSAARRMHHRVPRLSDAVARDLAGREWPGNVRELQNAIERAVILSQNGPLVFEEPAFAQRSPTTPSDPGHEPVLLTRSELKQRERASIEAALQRTEGKVFGKTGAAALLGMKPTTLASRIKALGLRG